MPPLPPLQTPAKPPLAPTHGGDSDDDKLLKKIQGNILKAHGRDHTRLVLFWFDGAPGRADPNLRKFFADAVTAKDSQGYSLVTSGYGQWSDAEEAKAKWAAAHPGGPPWPPPGSPETFGFAPFYSLAISLPGLKRCGYTRVDLPIRNNKDSGTGFGKPANKTFSQLGDAASDTNPNKPKWEDAYANDDGPDGMWLLAHDNKNNELNAMTTAVVNFLDQHGAHRTVMEDGFRWTDTASNEREPFGFRDGLSQPLFFAADCAATPSGPQVPRWVNIPRSQVIIEDSTSPHDGGSFLVLRKLAQDVAAFRKFENDIKGQFGALPAGAIKPKEAGALLVGRERDGTPLAVLTGLDPSVAPNPDLARNEFDLEADITRCPFHAHIRKSNPRVTTPVNNNLDALFVRRGVVYDQGVTKKLPLPGTLDPARAADYPEGETITAASKVGLLFIGYMSCIGDQFVRMQSSWFADPTFPFDGANFGDPLLRPLVTGNDWPWQQVPPPPPPAPPPPITVPVPPNFSPITPMGGAYFYVPSVTWLQKQWPLPAGAGGTGGTGATGGPGP